MRYRVHHDGILVLLRNVLFVHRSRRSVVLSVIVVVFVFVKRFVVSFIRTGWVFQNVLLHVYVEILSTNMWLLIVSNRVHWRRCNACRNHGFRCFVIQMSLRCIRNAWQFSLRICVLQSIWWSVRRRLYFQTIRTFLVGRRQCHVVDVGQDDDKDQKQPQILLYKKVGGVDGTMDRRVNVCHRQVGTQHDVRDPKVFEINKVVWKQRVQNKITMTRVHLYRTRLGNGSVIDMPNRQQKWVSVNRCFQKTKLWFRMPFSYM